MSLSEKVNKKIEHLKMLVEKYRALEKARDYLSKELMDVESAPLQAGADAKKEEVELLKLIRGESILSF